MTKNITLAVDDALLSEARKLAAEQNTTVNAVVRRLLGDWVAPRRRVEDALRELDRIADEAGMEVGRRRPSRDVLHER